MRIIQLIDSLESGGAERMAVNYASVLAHQIEFSGLVATRKEGILKSKVDKKVNYLYLNKKRSIDFFALLKLRKYCKKNKIDFIHAHSSSYFFAVLVKFTLPKIKVVWHDHYGNSDFLEKRSFKLLSFFSYFFSGIISVNQKLANWSKQKLKCKKVTVLYNFALLADEPPITKLKGVACKRIVLLANLRPQKNIDFLIDVAQNLKNSYQDWTFHVVGKHFNDNYQNKIFEKVTSLKLENTIYFYNAVSDVKNVLEQANIGVLTSKSEGLPLAILEYGLVNLPVVSTNVGDTNVVIEHQKNGFLVNTEDISSFVKCLNLLIEDQELRTKFGYNLNQTINHKFSFSEITNQYLKLLNGI
jgi:glycosyltransferase involved in cell wall biosynthesis